MIFFVKIGAKLIFLIHGDKFVFGKMIFFFVLTLLLGNFANLI